MMYFLGIEAYLSAIVNLITILIPVIMVAWKAEKKKNFVLRLSLCSAVILAISLLATFLVQFIFESQPQLYAAIIYIQLAKFFLIFLLSGMLIFICFRCDRWGALFCATAGYCVQHISARIATIIHDSLFPDGHWALEMVIGATVAAAVFVAFWFVFLRNRDSFMLKNVENKWQVALAACVVGVSIFYNSFGLSYLVSIKSIMESAGLDATCVYQSFLFEYIMSALVALLALIIDFGLSDNKRLSKEKEKLEQIIDEGKRQYEYEKNNIEMINLKCHDLKHHLAALKGQIYEEQIDELKNVIQIYDSSIKTGNEALDVVLTQKNFYCSGHGIRLTCLLNGENYNFIARHELYTLFNNSLDNAIEAVEQLPEEKRIISITEKSAKGFLSVRIENYFDGNAIFKDGLPVTSKKDEGHGYGIKSIKLIAEKYGGGISVSSEADLFMLDIFFRK